MERSWFSRVALIVVVAIWSLWQLVPSYPLLQALARRPQRRGLRQVGAGLGPGRQEAPQPRPRPAGRHPPRHGRGRRPGRQGQGGAARRRGRRAPQGEGDPLHARSPQTPPGCASPWPPPRPATSRRSTLDFYGAELYAPGGAAERPGPLRLQGPGAARVQGQGRRAGREDHPQPRRQVGRQRAGHQAQGQQPDPDPAARLQGSGQGQGPAGPHRPARVQDLRRRERRPRRGPDAAPGLPVDARRHDLPAPRGRLLDGGDASSCPAAASASPPWWPPTSAPSSRRSSPPGSTRCWSRARTASASARWWSAPRWSARPTTAPTCSAPRPS